MGGRVKAAASRRSDLNPAFDAAEHRDGVALRLVRCCAFLYTLVICLT